MQRRWIRWRTSWPDSPRVHRRDTIAAHARGIRRVPAPPEAEAIQRRGRPAAATRPLLLALRDLPLIRGCPSYERTPSPDSHGDAFRTCEGASGLLGPRSRISARPSCRHGEKQRIQSRVVKSFSAVPSGRKHRRELLDAGSIGLRFCFGNPQRTERPSARSLAMTKTDFQSWGF